MRLRFLLLFALAGCYEQPVLTPDHPLTCVGGDARNDCPVGFGCVAGVCATRSCRSDLDCPMNLACSPRGACFLPGAPGSMPPGGPGALDGDAGISVDAGRSADAPGGN